jgi:putative ABC transport system permease protein
VNQELARRLSTAMGGADPVGKIVGLTLGHYVKMEANLQRVEIAGVIRTERVGDLYEPEMPIAYSPLLQEPERNIRLIVRTRGDASAVVPAMREVVRQIDPRLPLGAVRTMRQVKERSFTGTTQSAWVIGAFAVLAALLAAFGLYGVLAQAVAQQRREIGIRMALGAGPRAIVFQVLRRAGAMVAVGLVLGLAGAVALTGLMKSLLFQVSALDPAALMGACAAMTLVGLLATLLPANRAARVDPVTTLREEG